MNQSWPEFLVFLRDLAEKGTKWPYTQLSKIFL